MTENWPSLDDQLISWRTRIYSLIPDGWTFVGPTKSNDGWAVAVRRIDGFVVGASDPDLQAAFVALGEELTRRSLRTSGAN